MTLCKYCKSKNHNIDECLEIICKNCKKKGHPHWKCINDTKEVKYVKKNEKDNNLKNNYIENLDEVSQYEGMKWSQILLR